MTFARLLFLSIMSMFCQANAQSFPKWLAVGDSITQHGPNTDLNWDGPNRGMAASELQKDYVHVLRQLIQERDPESAKEIKIVGRLGKLSAGTMDQMETVLGELRAWEADLVTIQLGENDRLKEAGAEGFEQRYRALVDGLLSAAKPPRVLCTGVWAPGVPVDSRQRYAKGTDSAIKEEIIEKICREKGLTFVSVAQFASKPENSGFGETPGVKWHPNDAGMKAYAKAIFTALRPAANAP